jgi:hypothetical protein
MDVQNLLLTAELAAQSGQRETARALFLQAAEQDPGCEAAWLWLSELQEAPAERMHALERALQIRPDNPSAAALLAQLRAGAEPAEAPDHLFTGKDPDWQSLWPFTGPSEQPQLPSAALDLTDNPFEAGAQSSPSPADDQLTWREQTAGESQDVYQQAAHLAEAGEIEAALTLLYALVEVHSSHVEAWRLIAQLSPSAQGKIAALQKAAAIQPENEAIRADIQRLTQLDGNPFLIGQQHEERGEREQARLVYEWIQVHARSATARLEAARRIEDLRISGEAEHLHRVSPTLNLLRLTAGPAVLFGLLVFIQSGLNPLKLPLTALLGGASVLAGSLLVNVTGLRPLHPRWVKAFGRPGSPKELEMRFDLRLLGWALLAAPFLLFFIEALRRLMVFRAAMEY